MMPWPLPLLPTCPPSYPPAHPCNTPTTPTRPLPPHPQVLTVPATDDPRWGRRRWGWQHWAVPLPRATEPEPEEQQGQQGQPPGRAAHSHAGWWGAHSNPCAALCRVHVVAGRAGAGGRELGSRGAGAESRAEYSHRRRTGVTGRRRKRSWGRRSFGARSEYVAELWARPCAAACRHPLLHAA